MRVVSNDAMVRAENARRDAEQAERNKEQVLSGLAGYVMPLWEDAKRAKNEIRPRLLMSLRQRRGDYEPDKLAEIRKIGGSEIYMMLTSVKCRAAGSWLRDALLGKGYNKPWTVSATPVPELPDNSEQTLLASIGQEVGQMAAMGVTMPPEMVRERIDAARESLMDKLREKARLKAQGTEDVLEDELVEGGYLNAIDEFIDDFVTYPAAILKGPVLHSAPVLRWVKQPNAGPGQPQYVPVVENQTVKRWYRVDPFKFYPAAWATDIEDGPCFEHHRITQQELYALIGAPGYDEDEIRTVISEWGAMNSWLGLEWQETADSVNQPDQRLATDGPADALEFYGPVPGKLLIEWGLDDPAIDDPEKSYNVNLWMVGRHVIKAVINPDPLGKKPYRKGCYEDIPGAFWGNGVPDLIRDLQTMCNAAARALSNNMAIASGPQVAVNVSRMPPGTDITQLYPWKVHQFESDPLGSTAPPIDFFQPGSNAMELVNVFTFFANLADEYSGLPRYMTGDTNIGGAGRTASGLSTLVGNANRLMKSVMASIDRITVDVLQSLHNYLMQFEYDKYPQLEGDINIVARGAASVMAREQLALRRNEFLQATNNPADLSIVGPQGRAYLLRELAKALELDTDQIVSPQAMNPPAAPPAQPGAPGMGEMPGRPGQPGAPVPQPGSAPVQRPNQRPIGATMDRT